MEQLHIYRTWHHNWKFWGQNHDIYTHYGKFTEITTIWVRIRYNFTYRIVSDKHFLWNIFWTNTQSGFFHVACGAQNITVLLWPCWYEARHGVRKEKWLTASEGGKSAVIKKNACIESKVKIAGCATVARTTLIEMQKLHKGRYKLIGKALSLFGQHNNYFNMNNMGQGIFWAWTHCALTGERKTSGIEQYRQERRPRNISGHTTEEVKVEW